MSPGSRDALAQPSRPGRDRPVPAAIRHGHVPLRLAKTRTRGDSFIRLCASCGEHDSLRRFVRETCQIAIGQFGDSACRLHECCDKADTPRLRPKRASASIPLSGRSLARHRFNWLLEIPPPTMGTPNKACCVPPQSPFSKSLRANHFEWRLSLDSI